MIREGLQELNDRQDILGKMARLMLEVNDDVLEERVKQNEKWGYQRNAMGDWLMVLAEEFGEVAEAMQASKSWSKKTDAKNLYKELIQLSAVASAVAEQVKEERGV